eukprot:ANDGO_08107.mRNA.1 hypothetical protein
MSQGETGSAIGQADLSGIDAASMSVLQQQQHFASLPQSPRSQCSSPIANGPRGTRASELRKSLSQNKLGGWKEMCVHRPSPSFSSTSERFTSRSGSSNDLSTLANTSRSSSKSNSPTHATGASMMYRTTPTEHWAAAGGSLDASASMNAISGLGSHSHKPSRASAPFGGMSPRFPSVVSPLETRPASSTFMGHQDLLKTTPNRSGTTLSRGGRFEEPKSHAPPPGAYDADDWFLSKPSIRAGRANQ